MKTYRWTCPKCGRRAAAVRQPLAMWPRSKDHLRARCGDAFRFPRKQKLVEFSGRSS